MSKNLSLIIPFLPKGQRIDLVLAQALPQFSRSLLSLWLKEGKITVNKQQVKPKEQVFGGEIIDFSLALEAPHVRVESAEAENIPLDLVYEDDHLLVISKPAGLIVHPGAGNFNHTLVNALLYHDPALERLPRAGIIHRLDKDTTGLLVVAKTLESHTSLIRQMQARTIRRIYLALVQGHLIAGGEIETYYGRHPRSRLKMAVCAQGRHAITHYRIRKQFQSHTLLEVELFTGRTHQIRVHMAHIKHPVVGDPLYGGRMHVPKHASEELLTILQRFKRQALHAHRLSFQHPATNEILTFEANLPDDFNLLLQALEKNG